MADVISTIGAGQLFTDLQPWIDDITSNANGLYTTGDRAIAEVSQDLSSSSKRASFGAANATNPIANAIVRPTAGNQHNDDINAGFELITTHAGFSTIELAGGCDYNVRIEDLIIRNNNPGATAGANLAVNLASNAELELRRCILRGEGGAAEPRGAYSSTFDKIIHLVRCSIMGCGDATNNLVGSIQACRVDNCINGFVVRSGSWATVNNCIAMRCSTACYVGTTAAGSDKNMASDATAPGTIVYNNEVPGNIWVDPDNADYTLQTGTNANGTGDNLGTDREQNIDIRNVTVTGDWDLGPSHLGITIHPGMPVGTRRIHKIGF